MNPTVLLENKEVVFIDKPAGLMVHPDGRSRESTLVDWIRAHYPEMEGVGEPMRLYDGTMIDRPGVVHRLDRETSGVMVLARTQESFLNLKSQFQNHATEKTYVTFVWGRVTEDHGVIDRPIGRAANNPPRWSAQRGARGAMREAVTHYATLLRSPEHSYLEVSPLTGRTHQIRVHLKAIHHPVVGDVLYAPKRSMALGFERVALHARRLAATLLAGERIVVEAPLPPDFIRALSILQEK